MLQGEWFRGDILGEVMAIIAKEAASPAQPKTNVIVSGDCDRFFVWSSDPAKMAERTRLQATVLQGLAELHGKTPLAWVITGGERLLDHFAWQWADENKVQVHRYFPNGGSTKGLLRSRWDH